MNPSPPHSEPETAKADVQGMHAGHPVRPGPVGMLVLAVWLGLACGAIELAEVWLQGGAHNLRVMFGKSRHYPWMIPVTNAALFVAFALPVVPILRYWPRAGARLGSFGLGVLAILTPLAMAMPWLLDYAKILLAMGLASVLVPPLRSRAAMIDRVVRWSLPVFLVGLAALGATTIRRDGAPDIVATPEGRDGPNVLLIVLDTVRADHLSLYGYDRPTSPNLSEWARRGVLFSQARATAPWTLTSHVGILTGRWPHETSAGWYQPLDDSVPTLAEFLAGRGVSTAGFVANLNYCSYFTGLDRGFSHYEDLPATPLRALEMTRLGAILLGQIDDMRRRLHRDKPPPSIRTDRKTAAEVNRAFLDWLDNAPNSEAPFFAFLNYFDAHDPYIVPEGHDAPFGRHPETPASRALLRDWWSLKHKGDLPPESINLVRDAYDSCIHSIDTQIDRLLRNLDRRGILDKTIVLITSDHGEAFGEHDLFGHGGSLYDTEIHVPLVIMAPGLVPEGRVIAAPVSLRDLPATVVDLLDLEDSPFPGSSLARFWSDSTDTTGRSAPAMAEVDEPTDFNPNHGRSPVFRGQMDALINKNAFKYIYNGDGVEELYHLPDDPGETKNLVDDPTSGPILEQFRRDLSVLEGPRSNSP